jgi:hypothetical protein
MQSQSCCPRTLRLGRLRRKKLRRFLNIPIPCPHRNMHELQVPQTFGETPPPLSTAGEDVVTRLHFGRNTCELVVTFFSLYVLILCQLAFGTLIYYTGYTAARSCSTYLSDAGQEAVPMRLLCDSPALRGPPITRCGCLASVHILYRWVCS